MAFGSRRLIHGIFSHGRRGYLEAVGRFRCRFGKNQAEMPAQEQTTVGFCWGESMGPFGRRCHNNDETVFMAAR
jgi:hypothetical protein